MSAMLQKAASVEGKPCASCSSATRSYIIRRPTRSTLNLLLIYMDENFENAGEWTCTPERYHNARIAINQKLWARNNRSKNQSSIAPQLHKRDNSRLNKQWEVTAFEQVTSHIEQVHNNRDPSRLH